VTVDPSLSYEAALARLDDILRRLEDGSLSLEDAIAAVEQGKALLEFCQGKLDEARQRIETMPVHDELPEEEPPHPATLADLRSEIRPGSPTQDEIPF
jgi:exodeoxyribonuclease VII small subunit